MILNIFLHCIFKCLWNAPLHFCRMFSLTFNVNTSSQKLSELMSNFYSSLWLLCFNPFVFIHFKTRTLFRSFEFNSHILWKVTLIDLKNVHFRSYCKFNEKNAVRSSKPNILKTNISADNIWSPFIDLFIMHLKRICLLLHKSNF